MIEIDSPPGRSQSTCRGRQAGGVLGKHGDVFMGEEEAHCGCHPERSVNLGGSANLLA